MSIYKAQWGLRSLKTVLLRYSGIWTRIIFFDILTNYLRRFLAKCVLLLFPVNCYPGSYSDNKTQTCELCIPGFYQDEEGKEECQPCPKNSSSVITGSKSAADCKRKHVSSVSPSPGWISLSSLTCPRSANVRKVNFFIRHCWQFTLPISLISRNSFTAPPIPQTQHCSFFTNYSLFSSVGISAIQSTGPQYQNRGWPDCSFISDSNFSVPTTTVSKTLFVHRWTPRSQWWKMIFF